MQKPVDKGLERTKLKVFAKVKNVACFCLSYIEIKMTKLENILYFWLSSIRKNKFSKMFFRTSNAQK